MILIKKNPCPGSLLEYSHTPNSSFDDLPKEVKDDLRSSLLKEQGNLCAYCMKKIDNNSFEVKIEHYVARNSQNQLDYKNLLAVCKGNEGEAYKRQNCDTKKGNRVLHINPQLENDIATIYYGNDGTIKSSNKVFQDDLDNVLNLNDRYSLVKARKEVLSSLQKKLGNIKKGKTLSRKKLEQIYKTFSEKKPAYVGIMLWYLEKKIKKSNV